MFDKILIANRGRNTRRRKRHSTTISATASTTNTTSATRNHSGSCNSIHSPPANIASSPSEVVTLVTGSGEVLIAARAPALAKCVPAASVPPARAAATCKAPLGRPSPRPPAPHPPGCG